MTKQKRLARPDQFTVTQKLGFPPVLHCWCGTSCLHKKDWPRFTKEHNECLMKQESSDQTGREADYETAWAAYKRLEPRYSRTSRLLADI